MAILTKYGRTHFRDSLSYNAFWHSTWHLFWHSFWHLLSLGNARRSRGACSWDLAVPQRSGARSWGPAAPTEICSSLAVPTDMWPTQLRPAIPIGAHGSTDIRNSQLRSGSARGEKWRRREGRRKEGEGNSFLKSKDSHLAGVEKREKQKKQMVQRSWDHKAGKPKTARK